MAMFGKTILRESEDLPVVDHEVTSEEIATQVEDDKLDIIETIHGDDVEEITAEKEIQDAVEAGATQDEVEALQESFIVLKENKAKEFFAKIWEKIQALWAKIKAFFKHILMYIRSMFMSAKDFVDKYEKELKKIESDGKLSEYEYNGFDYKTDTVLDNVLKALDYYKKEQNNLIHEYRKSHGRDDVSEYKEERRVELIKKFIPAFTDGDEVDNMMYKEIRSGAVNSTDTKKIRFSVKTVVDRVRKAVKQVDSIKSAENKIDGIFNDAKKHVKSIEDETVKRVNARVDKSTILSDDKKENFKNDTAEINKKKANTTYQILSQSQAIITSALSTIKNAYNEEMNTLKRVCAGAFSYARKQK